MKLYRLLNGIEFEVLAGELSMEISSISDNSKDCSDGSLFFSIVGTRVDATGYVDEAIKNGATAIILEKEFDVENLSRDVTIIKVRSVRAVVGLVAKNFYCPNGYSFKIVGITGTNGKTTTSFIIGDALWLQNKNVCVVGTSGIFVNGKCLRGEALTTPDPIELQSLFKFLNEIEVDYVVMEVSAHALDLEKTAGVCFDYSIFTNLTEDHLDYFKTMENYGAAKEKLFLKNKSKVSIINLSDNFGLKISQKIDAISYGVGDFDYKISPISNNSFWLEHNNKRTKYRMNISGVYNIYNAVAAIVVLEHEGASSRFIKKYLKHLKIIDGRYNEFRVFGYGKVVLDFAHTPDGLDKLLDNVRANMNGNGRLISVFGCGGNRDRGKRSIMGKVSGAKADYTIISIDNPRFEAADAVMGDIEIGVKQMTNNYEIIMPRSQAIKRAILMSGEDDVVVISGKGTEPYYEVNGKKEFYREDIVIDCIKKILER